MIKIKVSRLIKACCYTIFSFMLLELCAYLYGFQFADLLYYITRFEQQRSYIEQTYRLDVLQSIKTKQYPQEWLNGNQLKPYHSVVFEDNPFFQSRFASVIYQEIDKIPPKVIVDNLTGLYAIRQLVLNGSHAGGTYSVDKKSIFISTKNKNNRNVKKGFIKRAFHHELSSILMHNFKLSEERWRSAQSNHFLYKADSDPAYEWMFLRGHIDPVDKYQLLDRGLLNQYSETGVENDFNTYAEVIFTEPKRMKKLIKKYPVIQRKYQIFKAFYLAIDPGFSKVFNLIDK